MPAVRIRLMLLLIVAIVNGVVCDIHAYNNLRETDSSLNEVIERPQPPSWLRSAQDLIASPAGHVAVQMAKELINRSVGNTQVLSLNLSNLLIIVLLKVLIFAAGLLGATHWGSYGYGYGIGRSSARSDDLNFNFGLSEGEDYLITGFLAAQGAGIDDCLYAAACASPTVAYEYARAAKALLEGIAKFEGMDINNPRYNDLIVLVEKAAHDGLRGMPCNINNLCDKLL